MKSNSVIRSTDLFSLERPWNESLIPRKAKPCLQPKSPCSLQGLMPGCGTVDIGGQSAMIKSLNVMTCSLMILMVTSCFIDWAAT